METQNLLDVRILEPRLKHPTIFQRFDDLNPGEELIIVNDHDPLPLFYQFKAERPEQFEWNYLENGPETWQVSIGKTSSGKTVANVVLENPRAVKIFKKYRIDFCCKGKRPLEQACAEAGVDTNDLLKEIAEVAENPQFNLRANEWTVDFLADYIIHNHHKYVRETLPELLALLNKVKRVHGDQHPELIEIDRIFNAVAEELTLHMQKEEQILFPAIKAIYTKATTGNGEVDFPFGSIQNPINMMEEEHTDAGDGLEAIAKLSDNYTPPPSACTSYRVVYDMLQAFENDLHNHVHLENNLLFPKALELEKTL